MAKKEYRATFTAVSEMIVEADSEKEAREIAMTLDLEWDSIELESIEEE